MIRTMMYRMRIDRGMGLAANQIGVMARILVIATEDYQQYMINPQIVTQSKETCEMEEGCLSFDMVTTKRFRVKKTRPQRVSVFFKRIDGSGVTIELEGLPARVFFHEYDHLNGLRMIDNDDPAKLRYQIERLKKHQR
jgi:peptide deformylase